MIAYLLAQLALVVFNLINSRIDAYRIMANKTIAHGINFGAYAVFVAFMCYVCHREGGWNFGVITLFCVAAFCNRQWSFDVPLNIRRRLPWDYVTKAKPPAAILDRIEIRIFGYNGRAPVLVYAGVWVVCLIIKIWV